MIHLTWPWLILCIYLAYKNQKEQFDNNQEINRKLNELKKGDKP